MDKIAIISDIHGNYEALKMVLSDIKKRKIKYLYCLGDVIGKGTKSNECFNLLKDCVMVYGNWEYAFNNKICRNELDKERYRLLDNQISKENKEKLKTLPLSYELYISGRLVRMFHATPNNIWDNILGIDRVDKLYKQFLPTQYTGNDIADIVLYGHTHTQNMLRLYNRVLINVGSVGNAFDVIRNIDKDGKCENTTNADYLIIEGEINSKKYTDIKFDFISLKYDIKRELESNKNNPELENYSKELLTGTFREVEIYKDNFTESFYDFDRL